MHPAAPLTGTRRIAALVVACTTVVVYHLWPAPERAPAPEVLPVAPRLVYVPLLGDELRAAVANPLLTGGCVPFTDVLVTLRNWSFQLVFGHSGDNPHSFEDSFAVGADGNATWDVRGMPPRQIHLTSAEMKIISGMDHIPCHEPIAADDPSAFVRIAPAGDPEANEGARVARSSLLGRVLEAVFDGATARYRTQRLAELDPFEIHVTASDDDHTWSRGTARYRVDVDPAGHLTVRHGRAILVERDLTEEERVDLVDGTLAHPESTPDPETITARGQVVGPGLRVPFAFSRWWGPAEVLQRSLDEALRVESETGVTSGRARGTPDPSGRAPR